MKLPESSSEAEEADEDIWPEMFLSGLPGVCSRSPPSVNSNLVLGGAGGSSRFAVHTIVLLELVAN